MASTRPSHIAPRHWTDWRWQMQHRIHTVEDLRDWITPTADELQGIEATQDVFRWNIEALASSSQNRRILAVFTDCPP